jgi:DNA-binding MarR family transcriptional regulator
MPLDLASALSLAGSAVDRHVLQRLHDDGFPELRVGHGYVVQRLLVGPHTVTELAAGLGVTQQAVSKSVAEMVAAGLLDRVADPHDARRRPLVLSARGRAAVAAARAARADVERDLARATGDPDVAARLLPVLRTLLDVLRVGEAVARRAVPPPPG